MKDIANLLINGRGFFVPVIMDVGGEAKKGRAFFTMGMSATLKEESTSRYICPGISNFHHGGRNNNTHSVPYIKNLLVSPTHCIIIDTKAPGQTRKISKDNDGIYAGIAIMIGNECRIICHVHENLKCNKSDELVRYDVKLDRTYQRHQFMLI